VCLVPPRNGQSSGSGIDVIRKEGVDPALWVRASEVESFLISALDMGRKAFTIFTFSSIISNFGMPTTQSYTGRDKE
jgi:hypothetical protein